MIQNAARIHSKYWDFQFRKDLSSLDIYSIDIVAVIVLSCWLFRWFYCTFIFGAHWRYVVNWNSGKRAKATTTDKDRKRVNQLLENDDTKWKEKRKRRRRHRETRKLRENKKHEINQPMLKDTHFEYNTETNVHTYATTRRNINIYSKQHWRAIKIRSILLYYILFIFPFHRIFQNKYLDTILCYGFFFHS